MKGIGDDHQAMILVTLKAAMGPDTSNLLAARHYTLDEHEKIKNELVIIANYDGEV